MNIYVCLNHINESVKYVSAKNLNIVNNYISNKEYSITEMPFYFSYILGDRIEVLN